jgi:hypothetical protein
MGFTFHGHVSCYNQYECDIHDRTPTPPQAQFLAASGFVRAMAGYSLVALLLVVALLLALSALTFSALAVGLMALVALARLIALLITLLSTYQWSDIVENLGKWVRIWRGMIVLVAIRVVGVASHAARIVGLSESWTGSKTVVSFPAPTRQNEG